MKDLSCYIVRACFSQERMRYLPATYTMDGQAKVVLHRQGRQQFSKLSHA
jgi:hypothetical protein